MTGCRCWSCQHPDSDNAGIRTLHTLRHIEFGEWLAARAPFTEPSPRALVVMTSGEMSVSGRCTVHVGTIAHPAHKAVETMRINRLQGA